MVAAQNHFQVQVLQVLASSSTQHSRFCVPTFKPLVTTTPRQIIFIEKTQSSIGLFTVAIILMLDHTGMIITIPSSTTNLKTQT